MQRNDSQPIAKRKWVSGVASLAWLLGFWVLSRGPALSEKATMGGEVSLDSLGFTAWFQIAPDATLPTRIALTTLNWIATNRQGMTFGVVFAALALVFLERLARRRFRSRLLNTLAGALVGAPLGVCVNCAAPIAHGMIAGGVSAEASVAAMIASPTLNVIVMTMMLSLLPWHLCAVKLGCTLALLLCVPLATRRAPVAPSVHTVAHTRDEGWTDALRWFARAFLEKLWFIIKATVPLMLLAGLLGAIAVTVLPLQSLQPLLPTVGAQVYLAMLGVALIAAALPVPIAFDVVLAVILYAAGLPARYVGVLLFATGAYSVYAMFIVSRAVHRRAALTLFVATVALGFVAGDVTQALENKQNQEQLALLGRALEDRPEPRWNIPRPGSVEVSPWVVNRAPFPDALALEDTHDIRVRFSELPKASAEDVPSFQFRRIASPLPAAARRSLFSLEYPFVQGRGRSLAAGDVDGDGRTDLLMVTEAGARLFQNVAGESGVVFGLRWAEPAGDTALAGYLVAESPRAEDGLSIVITGFRGDVTYRLRDVFNGGLIRRYERYRGHPAPPSVFTSAIAFADLNADGALDTLRSRWSPSWVGVSKSARQSHDELSLSERGDVSLRFAHVRSDAPPGAGTSIVFTQLLGEDVAIVGNDFAAPDTIYSAAATEGLTRADLNLPETTHDTMSIDAGDLDGDLREEVLFVDIARHEADEAEILSRRQACIRAARDRTDESACDAEDALYGGYLSARRRRDGRFCLSITDPRLQSECIAALLTRRPTIATCAALPESFTDLRALCMMNAQQGAPPPPERTVQRNRNVLLRCDETSCEDRPGEIARAGWAWNARFADLDSDGDLDVFVVNGTPIAENHLETNHVFENRDGELFLNDNVGLESFRATATSVQFDIDSDGDLDVITLPMQSDPEVYENLTPNRSVIFELVDRHTVVGARVMVRSGDEQQLRVLRASGGYQSQNPLEAHFGVGDRERVDEVTVVWPDGTRHVLRDLPTQRRYKVIRNR